MKRILVASLAALALTSGSALAADLGKPYYKAPPPPAPVYSWTGCYLDAGGGYGMWNQDHYTETTGLVPISQTYTNGGRGWLGRVGGGCDYQIAPKWVIGAFGDYDFMNLHGTNEFAPLPGDYTGTEKESGAWVVGGRIGYLVAPDVLSFFDGGYTQARFDQVNFNNEFSGAPVGLNMPAQTYNGWFLGGGTENSLASWLPGLPQGLFLRTEYRYSSYQAADVPIYVTSTGALYGDEEHVQKYVQTITTSLVWRFNFSAPVFTKY